MYSFSSKQWKPGKDFKQERGGSDHQHGTDENQVGPRGAGTGAPSLQKNLSWCSSSRALSLPVSDEDAE